MSKGRGYSKRKSKRGPRCADRGLLHTTGEHAESSWWAPAPAHACLGHICSHTCTGQYLSRPSWETQPSWRATLPNSPRASGSRREESEEEREPLGRQEVHQASACKAPVGLATEGGGGEGSDFLAPGWLLGVGLSDYRGPGTQPAGMGIMRCLLNAGILWSTENPTQSLLGRGPTAYHCPGKGSLDLSL